MKMLMIVFNEAIGEEVMETLRNCRLKNYTRIDKVAGMGASSGAHMGNDIWPGLNNILLLAVRDQDAAQLLKCVGALRGSLGREGIKAFVWNLEEVT